MKDQNKGERRKIQTKEASRRWVEKHQNLVEIPCKRCEKPVAIKEYKVSFYSKRGGIICPDCCKILSSEKLKQTRAKETSEERSIKGKKARQNVVDPGESVRKQWKTIKSDPAKMESLRQQRAETTRQVWQDYDEKTRNHIIERWTKGAKSGRSHLSDDVKQAMISAGLYDGFVSEEVFHGFIPDEINHDLKLIVEVFGDVYHCHPLKYTDSSEYRSVIKRTVGEQWKRDERKAACYFSHGYALVIIWESDFRRDPETEIDRVRKIIGERTLRTR